MQYRLRERATALGWSDTAVVVIDDDLGQSGTSIAGRPGFQRLLAEIGLDHVGIILGIEMSRLARSNRDWHQLLELCGVFGTLLADADGVYDPCDYNDRLLLGLKGTMSEAELHVLQSRLTAGQKNKARRGEFFTHPPIGYIRSNDKLVLEPDEQARGVVQLIFEKFAQLGAVAAVLRFFVNHSVRIGVRDHRGPQKGELTWRRPNLATLTNLLHHPVYAGAYVYGRRSTDPRKRLPGRPGTGRAWAASDDWQVLIHDALPAYISWDQYEANQKRMRENSTKFGRGAPRGASLLTGLVTCGRCGRRMSVSYAGTRKARFTCDAARNHFGDPQCQALSADSLEALVERQVLAALDPASLELSLQAADRIEADRERLEQNHRQAIERASFEVERAWRQYTAVEPEHRLVARELEHRWEEALRARRLAEDELELLRRGCPSQLHEGDRDRIQALANDIPALWHASSTSGADRQEIARQLIDRVDVTVLDGTERVDVVLHWAGGFQSRAEIHRPVSSYLQLHDVESLLSRVVELKRQGFSHREVAQHLNAEGFHAPRGDQFSEAMASFLWQRARREGRVPHPSSPAVNEWRGRDLSARVNVPASTLNTWRRRGWIHARRVANRWIYWADDAELARLLRLRKHPRPASRRVPRELLRPVGQPRWAAG
jgi:DNA invertase Pin-like site-specific DNA recombinase